MNTWINSKEWKENWRCIKKLSSGGQAIAKYVENSQKQMAFLKILNRQNDIERRARFFREATAYETATHLSIPKLIESNAHNYKINDFKLYIVTEFIKGKTLKDFINENGSFNFHDASTILKRLLDVIEYCHKHEWIHRDIKPDNIILKDNLPSSPILLDFGISYKDISSIEFNTEDVQELGNRFLRLPEMGTHSTSKRDVRTDLSFLGGIFYYLLTSNIPSNLSDEQGKMPHQKKDLVEKLKKSFNGDIFLLLSFFDKCFAYRLVDRFTSANEMQNSLNKLIQVHHNQDNHNCNITIDMITSKIDSENNQKLRKNKDLYDEAMDIVRLIHANIAEKVKPNYKSYKTGYVNWLEGLKEDLGFSHLSTHELRFVCSFLVKIIGEDIVIIANNNTIYRTDAEYPQYDKKVIVPRVETIFLNGLNELINKSSFNI